MKAIKNRDILYIYYAGDDTHRKGFRTIEPYTLGYIKKTSKDGKVKRGDLAIRAWQQAGASDTFKNPVGRWAKNPPRLGHEFFQDPNIQPGWRLFKIKDITSIYPTGKKFLEKKGTRPMYKNGIDAGLIGVLAHAETPMMAGKREKLGIGSLDEPNIDKQKISAFDAQSDKWKTVTNQEELELMNNLVALYEKVKTFDKSAPRYYDLTLKDDIYRAIKYNSRDRYKYTPDEVIGNLDDIYNDYKSKYPEDMKEIENALKNL
jgi:hypothetical protein